VVWIKFDYNPKFFICHGILRTLSTIPTFFLTIHQDNLESEVSYEAPLLVSFYGTLLSFSDGYGTANKKTLFLGSKFLKIFVLF
jgi:hypothetical protein